MAERRLTGGAGSTAQWFASEDGKHYRGYTTDLEPIFKHVRRQDEQINSASKRTNRSGWKYAGSIPTHVLIDWLTQRGASMEQWARNEGGLKDQFKKFLFSRENHKLLAHDAIRQFGR